MDDLPPPTTTEGAAGHNEDPTEILDQDPDRAGLPTELKEDKEEGDASVLGKVDSEAVNRAKVPSHFVVLKPIDDIDAIQDASTLKDKLVVVKVPNGRDQKDYNSIEIIRKEIDTVRHMPYNPRVVRFLETTPSDAVHPYIGMEAIKGLTLNECFESGHRPSSALVWHIFRELIAIVLWLHHGVTLEDSDTSELLPSYHGDIRGSNIMLDYALPAANGLPRVVLIDFGSACIRSTAHPGTQGEFDYDQTRKDLRALATQLHAMAHDIHPAEPPGGFWNGDCQCEDPRMFGGESGEVFVKIYAEMVNDMEGRDPADRKAMLLSYARSAQKELEATSVIQRVVRDTVLANDEEIAAAVSTANTSGPAIPSEGIIHPSSAATPATQAQVTQGDLLRLAARIAIQHTRQRSNAAAHPVGGSGGQIPQAPSIAPPAPTLAPTADSTLPEPGRLSPAQAYFVTRQTILRMAHTQAQRLAAQQMRTNVQLIAARNQAQQPAQPVRQQRAKRNLASMDPNAVISRNKRVTRSGRKYRPMS